MLNFGIKGILRRIDWKLEHIYDAIQRMEHKMSQMDDEIQQLTADVAAERTAVDSAVALIQGIATQIQAAVDAALAAGATPAQLQSLTDLHTAVTQQTQDIANAVASQSPPAGGGSAPPGPGANPGQRRNP